MSPEVLTGDGTGTSTSALMATLDRPAPGTILPAGDYLVVMEFARRFQVDQSNGDRTQEDVLVRALTRMGFRQLVLSAARAEEKTKPVETIFPSPVRFTFIGRLEDALEIHSSPTVAWVYVHPVPFDPFVDPEGGALLPNGTERELDILKEGGLYALRFLAWVRGVGTRVEVLRLLGRMGFAPEHLVCLRDNIRLRDRPGASNSLWYAVARWVGPQSAITGRDPFWFEDAVLVEAPRLEPATDIVVHDRQP